MTWLDVDGWLSPAEGRVLQALAAGHDVLEVGSYKGRSTVCLAVLARHVTSIDWHRGDDGCGPADTEAEFLANLDRFGVRDKVTVVVARLENVTLRPDSFDLAFVDAAHDFMGTIAATRLALSGLRAGGVIAWHDWNYPDVRAAVLACGLAPTGFMDTLAWVTV